MDIKTKAEQYAEKFRLIPETNGWYQQKVDDFTAGYEEALRQFTVSGSLPLSQLGDFVDWIREIGFAKYKDGWCQLGGSNGWHCSDEELIKMFYERGNDR